MIKENGVLIAHTIRSLYSFDYRKKSLYPQYNGDYYLLRYRSQYSAHCICVQLTFLGYNRLALDSERCGLLANIKQAGHRGFMWIERWFSDAFGARNNPFYFLGALAFFFYYIVIITGFYLFLFYRPGVTVSFDTVEYITHTQWYIGGVMRSVHRYASDAMVLTLILHVLREFFMDRYRGARWFTWLTGVPALLLVFPSGLIGYWLVWDKMGQFIAVRTAEWFDWLPIVSEPSARNFLTNTSVSDLFFRLLLIGHLVIPIFLLVAMLVHVKKISKSRGTPPRYLAIGTLIALLVLSLAVPAQSHERADLSIVPTILNIDWFYMFVYPLMDLWSMGAVWALVAGVTVLLILLPWLPPKPPEPPAEVYLENCSGCGLCVKDCPYEAIIMQPGSRIRPDLIREAAVIADNCVSCGICAGSCPSSTPFRRVEILKTGIDLPQRNVQYLLTVTREALAELSGSTKILVYGCDHGAGVQRLARSDIAVLSLPCTGALPPSFVAYALRYGASGVFVTGCRQGDCFHRLGNDWMEQRLARARKPYLGQSIPSARVKYFWASQLDEKRLAKELDHFHQKLKGINEL